MRLIELKCQNCGSTLEVDPNENAAFCAFCGARYAIDDEVQHVQYDNAARAGYEFEKGRQQAMREYGQPAQPKTRNTWLWVLGWFFMFPIPLTILLARNKTLTPALKYSLIAAGWVVYLLLVIAAQLRK